MSATKGRRRGSSHTTFASPPGRGVSHRLTERKFSYLICLSLWERCQPSADGEGFIPQLPSQSPTATAPQQYCRIVRGEPYQFMYCRLKWAAFLFFCILSVSIRHHGENSVRSSSDPRIPQLRLPLLRRSRLRRADPSHVQYA